MKAGRHTFNMAPKAGRTVERHPCPRCGARGLGLALKLDDRPGLHRQCRFCREYTPVTKDTHHG